MDSSSSKRKANDHADAPAPKKANTNTLVPRVPRAPGERYQGTAARPPPESRPALKEKPVKKARDIDPMDVDIRSSLEKSKTWQQSDVSSSSGRKRNAEHDLNKSAAKKQRSNGLPPSNLLLTQSPQAGKAGPNRVICVKPTPKNNFFNSLYPKNSKIKASPGVSSVCTTGYQMLT